MEPRSRSWWGKATALGAVLALTLASGVQAQQAVNDVEAMAGIGAAGVNDRGLLMCPSETPAGAAVSGSAVIDGASGGQLAVGRFRLDVPAGAFEGRATFLVAVPDAGVLECWLEIIPRVSRFEVPVQLVVDCAAADAVLMERSCVLNFDERARAWKKAGGSSVDPSSGRATARLGRVSACAVGLDHKTSRW